MPARCGHCGQVLESAGALVGRPEQYCDDCQALLREAAVRAAEAGQAAQRENVRSGVVMAAVGGGAAIGAFGMSGFFGEPMALWFCYGIAVLGGIIGGLVSGRSWPGRLVQMPLAVLAGVGAMLATTWYLDDRSSVINYELLLPIALGALPGGVGMVIAGILLKRRGL